jgi:hypothetical protein
MWKAPIKGRLFCVRTAWLDDEQRFRFVLLEDDLYDESKRTMVAGGKACDQYKPGQRRLQNTPTNKRRDYIITTLDLLFKLGEQRVTIGCKE